MTANTTEIQHAFAATALAPSSVGPISMGPTSQSPMSGPRVTVLPRVERVGEETRVVREERVRYEHRSKLGEGGVGEVVGAIDHDIGRRVAVKRLHPGVKSDAALIRFADEVRTVGKLEHPNIVPIHDVGIDESGDHYFVMKYVDGETLETIIEKLAAGDPKYLAEYTVERRVELFMSLLEAVAFAHSKGIIHRDIKPANVMVGGYGELVLMDWGIAKTRGVLSDASLVVGDARGSAKVTGASLSDTIPEGSRVAFETHEGSLVGTPLYMSPEQATMQSVDERSDVYSLCVLFYELLVLDHPLAKKSSIGEVLRAVAEEDFPPAYNATSEHAKAVPVELSHTIRRGLQKDPGKRYQNVDELLARLRARAAGDIPIDCPVTLVKSSTGRWTQFVDRHPSMALLAFLFAILSMLTTVGGAVFLAVR